MPKLTDSSYPTLTSFSADDLVMIINAPGSTPGTAKINLQNFFANISTPVVVNSSFRSNTFYVSEKSTPANGSANSVAGHIWFDDNYIYVTTANNLTKRAALSSF